jgi:hypothetical protein
MAAVTQVTNRLRFLYSTEGVEDGAWHHHIAQAHGTHDLTLHTAVSLPPYYCIYDIVIPQRCQVFVYCITICIFYSILYKFRQRKEIPRQPKAVGES